MDGAVTKRLGKRLVDEAMLIDEREPCEARARDGHLKVIAASGAVLDAQLGGVGESLLEQDLEGLG